MRRNLALSLLAAFVLALGLGIQQSAADDAPAKTITQEQIEQLAEARGSLCSGTHGSFDGHCSDGWYDDQCASFCLALYPENGGSHGCFDNSGEGDPCSTVPEEKCCMCME